MRFKYYTDLKKENSKVELINILMSIKAQTRAIIIFGSHSINRSKLNNPKSDFDFLVVFKETSPYYTSISNIEKELSLTNIIYDFSWCVEDYLKELIKYGIDLHLYKSIFFEGEVIYSEEGFVENIVSGINYFKPSEVFFQSFYYHTSKIDSQAKEYARNLSRLCFDYISTLFCQFNNVEKWDELLSFDELIQESKKIGIIDDYLYQIMNRLIQISKMSLEDIGNRKLDIFEELGKIHGVMLKETKELVNKAMPAANTR